MNMGDQLSEMIKLLGEIRDNIATLAAKQPPVAAAPAHVANAATTTPQANSEIVLFITSEARCWKSGAGAFNMAKIDHSDGKERWSVGYKLTLVPDGFGWLHVGDVVAVSGTRSNQTYMGNLQPQILCSTLRVISRRNVSNPPPVQQQNATQQPTADNVAQQQQDADIPF